MGPKKRPASDKPEEKTNDNDKPAKTKKLDSPASTSSSKKPPLVIKCKTIFKKNLIERAIARAEEKASESAEETDERYKYPLIYDLSTGNFKVGHITVEVDETAKCIRCSECSYITKTKYPTDRSRSTEPVCKMEFGIRNHVIGQHLEGFRCKLCEPELVLHQSYSSHQRHMVECHNESRKQIDKKIKTELGLEDWPQRVSDSDSDETNSSTAGGQTKFGRPYKCSVASCGQRFRKHSRWQRHELYSHGRVVEIPKKK